MVIISKGTLKKFFDKHPQSARPLLRWYDTAKQERWSDFSELKRTFPSTDYVGNDLYVLKGRGNNYSRRARIVFSTRTVYMRFVGTHKEYDKVTLSDL